MQTNPYGSEDLFAAAIELPAAQREAYLIANCDDPKLRDEVFQLISSHEKNARSDFILDRPVSTDAPLPSELTAEIAETEGDTIGRYRLLERIGEGGMGVVYMAEQVEGVSRRVALKIIKLGMDTRQVIARFEAERQAMAMFDHPNITRVFDAGSTDTGRPYFVMELVRGTSITNYVAKNSLSLSERLRLFVAVCNAVQHAHQKGIIHRDLKPSNILVTLFDGVPVPKVIDFGIAKAMGQRLTEKTLFTRYSAMVGTPQYMSPEQAEMNGMDVDTRSDIYSLGVLLYELITGTTPVSDKELKQLNPLAIFETLRDAEIETPSIRLAKSKVAHPELNVVARSPKRIAGELDWVVMKSLARDRTLRYATAHEFSADVERYLDGDPVFAVPPSRTYRFRAYFNKHRAAVISGSLVASALVLATVMCSIFAFNASRANRKLSVTNQQLTENISRREQAERQVRLNAEEKLYDAAHSMALARFDVEFQPIVFEMALELFPELLEAYSVDENELGPDEFMLGICSHFDQKSLFDLNRKEWLEDSLQRLYSTMEKDEKFYQRLFQDRTRSEDDEEHEHSPECLRLQDKIVGSLRQYRPWFFGLLVDEYRRAFGSADPRVADGLDLLAASLIDTHRYVEAEARLREGLALRNTSDRQEIVKRNETSRRLLKLTQKKQ